MIRQKSKEEGNGFDLSLEFFCDQKRSLKDFNEFRSSGFMFLFVSDKDTQILTAIFR